jgi:hypothetical protein
VHPSHLTANTMQYFESTKGNWSGLTPTEIRSIIEQYKKFRRARNKDAFRIEFAGKSWEVDHQSISKNAYFQSRSFSLYLTCGTMVIRISDHWTATRPEYAKSRKLNCGAIRSCAWSCDGDRTYIQLPGERFDYAVVGGFIDFSDLQPCVTGWTIDRMEREAAM